MPLTLNLKDIPLIKDAVAFGEQFIASDVIRKSKDVVEKLVAQAALEQIAGEEKKKAVMEAFGVFYDNIISAIPIPYCPSVLSKKFFALIRPVVMEIVSINVEYAVSILKSKVQS